MGSIPKVFTAGAPIAWAPMRYRGFDEFRSDMKKMASACLLIPDSLLGKRIVGRRQEFFTVSTILSNWAFERIVEPPIIIAVVPSDSRSCKNLGSLCMVFFWSLLSYETWCR